MQRVVASHEEAGDTARDYRAYKDAAQHYQTALEIQHLGPSDRVRLLEKLAYMLSLGEDPSAAGPLFDRVFTAYLAHHDHPVKAIEILLQRARQLWLSSGVERALPLLAQAVTLAEKANDRRLNTIVKGRIANYLVGLARYKEARSFLDAIGNVDENDDPAVLSSYYTVQGILAAVSGNAHEAYHAFERAVEAAKKDTDTYQVASVWDVYGFWSMTLGNTKLAKVCHEQALLVARQYHLTWRVAHLSLAYANLLMYIGQYGLAHECVSYALASKGHAPQMEVPLAEAGIPLAHHMGDEALLAKCTHLSVIDFTFQSGESAQIASISSVFAQWHSGCGRQQEAQALLHRALKVLYPMELVTHVWMFPIAVARFGLLSDVTKARQLLEKRIALPSADVAYASLALFDAFVAQRKGRPSVYQYASEAQRQFEALGWHGYADLASTLLPTSSKEEVSSAASTELFIDLAPALTIRERQVAELALKGLTNRGIAVALSISENTVESHMASIMSRLGIHSRHLLGYVLANNQG